MFFGGVFLLSIGVAITVHAGLGTTTISSPPAVLAEATPYSLGTTTIAVNVLIVLLQIPILRRNFKLQHLLQIPFAVMFGVMCDISLWLTGWISVGNYLVAWILVILGSLIVSFGIFIQILAQIAFLPGEGLVQALMTILPKMDFGTIKQFVDWTLVLSAAAISWFTMHAFVGVREGTIFAAFALGALVRMWQKLYLKTQKS